ncbi:Meiosis specific protein SPO22 [Cordyceps militaris CM01]|uniref:Meiosis specific protein SPO22 n=1 Tax=Cordyceps militaris (strain CM01) TaxID=983644 RepID=G3JST0_CORMM|nr:Meiosis specific protein SPO22 [Cordyceps militaris CM01]EGX88926.1 Meiosis specific protein SPO22 [Cordyceps militaris CM01]
MDAHLLQPSHRAALNNAVLLQLQTLTQRPDNEAIWDAFHLLDCVQFHVQALDPDAVQAIHMGQQPQTLWTYIQSLYEQKRYTLVASWCRLALHSSLHQCAPTNPPTFLRRLLAALIELGQYADALTVLDSLPSDELTTRFLAFRLAVRAGDAALAQECLQCMATRADKDEARDALYACVREAQGAGDRVRTVEALRATAATWRGEVVVAANVPALLRCAIRLLQAEEAAEPLDAESFVSSETTAPPPDLHEKPGVLAASFVADHARDTHGNAVFSPAELRWFSANAYNLGVARCTVWAPGRLASLWESCLVFSQAAALLATPISEEDVKATDAEAATLTTLRCHFVLASLYVAEARLVQSEHTRSLYADVEKHAAAYTKLLTGSAAAAARCPDLLQKLGVLCVLHWEALLARQSHEHLPCIIQHARLCSDVDVLKALGGCVLQSEAPASGNSRGFPVKSSILKRIVNEIFTMDNFKSARLAQYLRCMVQVLLPMADDGPARALLEQAVQVAQESKQVGVAFPADEAQWLAAAAFNHGLTRYAVRQDMVACDGWLNTAFALAQHVGDDGQFAASLQLRRQTLMDSSRAGTL